MPCQQASDNRLEFWIDVAFEKRQPAWLCCWLSFDRSMQQVQNHDALYNALLYALTPAFDMRQSSSEKKPGHNLASGFSDKCLFF
jgi:hypothetical protein